MTDTLDSINRLPESFDESEINLDSEFGIKKEFNIVPFEAPEETDDELQDDIALARAATRNVIKKSSDILDDAAKLAKESEHPRALEVFGQLITAITGASEKLLELQKRTKALKNEGSEQQGGGINIDKAIFVGTGAELQDMIRQNVNKPITTIEEKTS